MSAILKSDVLDLSRLRRLLVGFLDESHPIYGCVLTLMKAGKTMKSRVSTTSRMRYWFRYISAQGLDPLEVTSDDVEAYLSSIEHLSPVTQQSILQTIRTLYARAMFKNLITANPAEGIRIGRHKPKRSYGIPLETVNTGLSDIRNEIKDGATRLVGLRDNFIFTLLWTIGPRTAEVLRLEAGDLQFGVARSTAEMYGKGRKHSTKKLPPVVIEAAHLWIAALEELLGRQLRPNDALVIRLDRVGLLRMRSDPGATLVPMSETAFGVIHTKRMRAMLVSGPRIGPHRSRKTAAVLAWKAKVDPTQIKVMLDHENLSTTLDGYIVPEIELDSAASDATPLRPMNEGDATPLKPIDEDDV